MERVFQIVAKGLASNKISVVNTTSYTKFEETLKTFKESECFVVLTTNTYFENTELEI